MLIELFNLLAPWNDADARSVRCFLVRPANTLDGNDEVMNRVPVASEFVAIVGIESYKLGVVM